MNLAPSNVISPTRSLLVGSFGSICVLYSMRVMRAVRPPSPTSTYAVAGTGHSYSPTMLRYRIRVNCLARQTCSTGDAGRVFSCRSTTKTTHHLLSLSTLQSTVGPLFSSWEKSKQSGIRCREKSCIDQCCILRLMRPMTTTIPTSAQLHGDNHSTARWALSF